MLVNHGTPVRTYRYAAPASGWYLAHDGDTGHDQLKPSEQCECGVLGIGIIKEKK